MLSSKNIIIIGAIILLTALIGSSYYFYSKYQKAQMLLNNTGAVGKEEVKTLVYQVGKLIELPANETPTVATVTDIIKLKDQPFFTKAKNGDKVLIYTQAKKAILYRPSTNKVIDVAPVNIGQAQNQPVKVALYNGTKTVGLTTIVEKQLKEKVENIDIGTKENASNSDYTKTLVIDLSGNQKAIAEQLAKVLQGEIAKLPDGEEKPKDAAILIILGKDYTK